MVWGKYSPTFLFLHTTLFLHATLFFLQSTLLQSVIFSNIFQFTKKAYYVLRKSHPCHISLLLLICCVLIWSTDICTYAWANTSTQTEKKEEEKADKITEVQTERLPLAFAAGRALPYTDAVNKSHVESLATASAYLLALERAAQNLHAFRSVRFTREYSPQAFAMALYDIAKQDITYTDTLNDTLPHLEAYVHLELLFPSFKAGIKTLLAQGSLLQMYNDFLEILQKTVRRGEHILAACTRNNSTNHNEICKTLPRIAQSLEALWLYYEALHFFDDIWKEPETVRHLLQKSLHLDKRFAGTWTALGEVQLQMDEALYALESLNTALTISPNAARALYIRGLGHLRLQQPVLAVTDFRAALAQEPNNTAWLRASGIAYMMLNDIQSMCQDFEKACALGDCEGLLVTREQGHCLPQDIPPPPTHNVE